MPAFNTQGERARRLFHDVIHHPALITLWPLNEITGDAIDRCTRYSLDGTVNGTPSRSSAILNHFYGVGMVGGGPYYSLGNVIPFDRSTAFSIMCLVDPNISALGEIIAKWNGTNAGWALGLNATGTLRLIMQATATTDVLEVHSTAALTNGTDTMVTVTYDGGSAAAGVVMYVNGAPVAMTTVTNNLISGITNTVDARIGAVSGGTHLLDVHTLAFLCLFNDVLSVTDVRRFAFLAGAL